MERMREHAFANGIDHRHFDMEVATRERFSELELLCNFTASHKTILAKTNFQFDLKMKRHEKKLMRMRELWKPIQGPYL
ncbi:hypothetical protein Vi05172_g9345 [Venturia inaequalis]|nr:hypothetical protein Vi05172_g9345 [Venturia inaequalis]